MKEKVKEGHLQEDGPVTEVLGQMKARYQWDGPENVASDEEPILALSDLSV